MQYFALIPFLMIFTGIGLSYTGVLPSMVGWVICALGVAIGLGCAITIIFTGQSHLWVFAIVSASPSAFAIPIVINDLRYPRINDVTTDIENPPAFVAALHAPANIGRDMVYPERYFPIMREAYPNIQPLILNEPHEQVFKRVEKLANTQSGWVVTHFDADKGTLEGEATTSFFHFVDDFIVRVTEHDRKSYIDMRSKSRDGLLDAGTNAKRIQNFFALLLNV